MPKKRSSSRKSRSRAARRGSTLRLRLLAAVLIVAAAAGVAAVKFLQTPRGQALLLDHGHDDYYAQVQEEIGLSLGTALEPFRLRRRIHESDAPQRLGDRTVTCRVWDIPCEESTNFDLVSVALTRAARAAGGVIRSSRATADGRTLVVRVGSHRVDTHRITFHKTRPEALPPPPPRPRLALVIDDFGYNRGPVVEELLGMHLPLSIAILPTLPYSSWVLTQATAKKRCVLLHLPMEPDEHEPSDIPAVTGAMSEAEIGAMVRRYVESLPGIVGVNNHQGSRATADPRVMHAVLKALEPYHLFFLDSLTSPKSVAYTTAKEMGVPTARNELFIDADTEDSEVVSRRLRSLVETARRRGTAIGIGHPHPWTLDALRENESYLRRSGIDLVYVSDLVN